jgi:hypothetical protein
VPGTANGAGGGAETLGYDPKTRLTPLTTNLAEFAPQIGEENREIAQYGWFFQWDAEVRQQHNVPMGPLNPQTLNRYAYGLNNPLRYTDPTGHLAIVIPLALLEIGGIGVVAIAVYGGYYFYLGPNAAQHREALAEGVSQLGEEAQNRYNDAMTVPMLVVTVGSEAIRAGINVVQNKYKQVKEGARGKQGATDIPSWAEGERPFEGESGKDFAKRLCDKRFGPGNYNTGPTSDYNKLKKYGDRHFK